MAWHAFMSCISLSQYLWNSKELLLTLQRPVSVFVNVIRASATYWHVNLDSSSPATAISTSYTAHTDQSLSDTINMMLTKRIHRIWLINKQVKLIHVMSLCHIYIHHPHPRPHSPIGHVSRYKQA